MSHRDPAVIGSRTDYLHGRMAGPPTYTTARTVVRPWRVEEADRLLDIRGRGAVVRWLSEPTPWRDVGQARDAIRAWSRSTGHAPYLGVWAIVPTATGIPAGSVSLGLLPDDVEVEIGWYLHPDSQGQGLATEAARGALAHGFAHGVDRIWAIMWPDNEASARVALAIGMRDLGTLPDPWYGTPEDPDSRMFRIDRVP